MGTPDFAVPTLAKIVEHGHQVVAVYTRAARPAGRRLEPRPSPVEHHARSLGLPVATPSTLRDEVVQTAFRTHHADVAVVVAYGLILPMQVLEAVPLGGLNLHASLLPRWRGAAPINRAIMAGDTETGVTVMKMEEGLDTGPVAMMHRVRIGSMATAHELSRDLASLGADLMVRSLAELERGTLRFTPQPTEGVSYARKIDKSETRIDWSAPWQTVHDHCRGLAYSPGAWFEMPGRAGALERVKVLRTAPGEGSGPPGTVLDEHPTVACGKGAVQLVQVQRAGRDPITGNSFVNGMRIVAGAVLG
jgi:methionyl-tRNA formyltransferase